MSSTSKSEEDRALGRLAATAVREAIEAYRLQTAGGKLAAAYR